MPWRRAPIPQPPGATSLTDLEDLQALSHVLRNPPRADAQRAPAPPLVEGPHMWSDLSGDIRYAARLLRRNGGFAAAALLTIALGVGAATAIFSVVDAVLLRPLPYPEAERLVALWETDRNSGTVREPASLPDLLDLREQSRRIDGLGGVIPSELNLTAADGEPRRLAGLYVSSRAAPAARGAACRGPALHRRRASGWPGRRGRDQRAAPGADLCRRRAGRRTHPAAR